MTIYPLSTPAVKMFRLPTRSEVRAAMLNTTAGYVTTLIVALIGFLAVLGAVVYLVAHGYPSDAVTGLLGGSLLALVLNLRSKLNDLHTEVKQASTNADAAVADAVANR
jgi:hypothetical protein